MKWEINFRLDLFWIVVIGVWLMCDWPRASAWATRIKEIYMAGPT